MWPVEVWLLWIGQSQSRTIFPQYLEVSLTFLSFRLRVAIDDPMIRPMFVIAFALSMAISGAASTAAGISSSGARDQEKSGWLLYRDQDGLSFRYPASLSVKVKPVTIEQQTKQPVDYHWAKEVIIYGDTPVNPHSAVLIFRHLDGKAAQASGALRLGELQQSCDKVTRLEMKGTIGYVCYTHGRAALHWGISILQPAKWDILSGLMGADYEEGMPQPHDGMFPILSILKTVSVQRLPRN